MFLLHNGLQTLADQSQDLLDLSRTPWTHTSPPRPLISPQSFFPESVFFPGRKALSSAFLPGRRKWRVGKGENMMSCVLTGAGIGYGLIREHPEPSMRSLSCRAAERHVRYLSFDGFTRPSGRDGRGGS